MLSASAAPPAKPQGRCEMPSWHLLLLCCSQGTDKLFVRKDIWLSRPRQGQRHLEVTAEKRPGPNMAREKSQQDSDEQIFFFLVQSLLLHTVL